MSDQPFSISPHGAVEEIEDIEPDEPTHNMQVSSQNATMAFATNPFVFQNSRRAIKPNISIALTPVCTLNTTRRQVLKLATLALTTTLLPMSSTALSLNETKISDSLDTIRQAVTKAKYLSETIAQWSAFEPDRKDFIRRYLAIWIDPAKPACDTIAKLVKPRVADPATVSALSTEMLGHFLEMREEISAMRKDGVLRELDEFMETAETILKTVKL